jgi:hypothetical protein
VSDSITAWNENGLICLRTNFRDWTGGMPSPSDINAKVSGFRWLRAESIHTAWPEAAARVEAAFREEGYAALADAVRGAIAGGEG